MPRRKPRTRERILDSLSRRGPRTAAELARTFRLSCTALRLQLSGLEEQGLVRAVETRASRGRPARAYDLTPAARDCFPDRAGAMAIGILEEVAALGGRDLVVKALEGRARRLGDAYLEEVRGLAPAEALRTVARLRDREGYAASAMKEGTNGPAALVERHCPVAALAAVWPDVCRVEEEVFRRVLGPGVRRREHILSGGRCCKYTVDEV